MGNPMAQNLIKVRCDVTVWNRTKSKCEPLISLGGYANFGYATDLNTNHPLSRLQHLVMLHLPCLQTPRVQRMLLVENMDLQKEWVQEK
ncbi:hypothetical protein H5410_025298, partial [Solanum commersonii]